MYKNDEFDNFLLTQFTKPSRSKTDRDIDIKPKPCEAQIPYHSEYESEKSFLITPYLSFTTDEDDDRASAKSS